MTYSRIKYQNKANDKFFIPKIIGGVLIVAPLFMTLAIGNMALLAKEKLMINSKKNK